MSYPLPPGVTRLTPIDIAGHYCTLQAFSRHQSRANREIRLYGGQFVVHQLQYQEDELGEEID